MAAEFRYREYRHGDADEINHLYATVTGRPRSIGEFQWQWLRAPGGPADIWLIEATEGRGKPKLIGHHGIMPIRFTFGAKDLRFGKTENTMVLPEYRSRILYPRFEKRFAAQYEARFDALFSTIGPSEAIRQRRALGYDFSTRWIRARIPTDKLGAVHLLCSIVLRRILGPKRTRSAGHDVHETSIDVEQCGFPLVLRGLCDNAARKDRFFESFWPRCRTHYGVTPRRDREDLDWRFWSNPYSEFVTLVSDSNPDNQGYVIFRRSKTEARAALLEDIAVCNPDVSNFSCLLDSALAWMKTNQISWIDFYTTSDSGAADSLIKAAQERDIYSQSLVFRLRKQSTAMMPRKITAKGAAAGLDTSNWFVTPILSEGRSD